MPANDERIKELLELEKGGQLNTKQIDAVAHLRSVGKFPEAEKQSGLQTAMGWLPPGWVQAAGQGVKEASAGAGATAGWILGGLDHITPEFVRKAQKKVLGFDQRQVIDNYKSSAKAIQKESKKLFLSGVPGLNKILPSQLTGAQKLIAPISQATVGILGTAGVGPAVQGARALYHGGRALRAGYKGLKGLHASGRGPQTLLGVSQKAISTARMAINSGGRLPITTRVAGEGTEGLARVGAGFKKGDTVARYQARRNINLPFSKKKWMDDVTDMSEDAARKMGASADDLARLSKSRGELPVGALGREELLKPAAKKILQASSRKRWANKLLIQPEIGINIVFDPKDGGVSNVISDDLITSVKPGDSETVARLKLAAEGLVIGAAFEALVPAARAIGKTVSSPFRKSGIEKGKPPLIDRPQGERIEAAQAEAGAGTRGAAGADTGAAAGADTGAATRVDATTRGAAGAEVDAARGAEQVDTGAPREEIDPELLVGRPTRTEDFPGLTGSPVQDRYGREGVSLKTGDAVAQYPSFPEFRIDGSRKSLGTGARSAAEDAAESVSESTTLHTTRGERKELADQVANRARLAKMTPSERSAEIERLRKREYLTPDEAQQAELLEHTTPHERLGLELLERLKGLSPAQRRLELQKEMRARKAGDHLTESELREIEFTENTTHAERRGLSSSDRLKELSPAQRRLELQREARWREPRALPDTAGGLELLTESELREIELHQYTTRAERRELEMLNDISVRLRKAKQNRADVQASEKGSAPKQKDVILDPDKVSVGEPTILSKGAKKAGDEAGGATTTYNDKSLAGGDHLDVNAPLDSPDMIHSLPLEQYDPNVQVQANPYDSALKYGRLTHVNGTVC